MATPFKLEMTIASGQSTSSAPIYVAEVDIRSIQFPAAFTGATISFTGAAVNKRSGNNDGTTLTYTAIKSAGSLVTVTASLDAIVVLSEAQRDAIASAAWIKIVSASSEGGDRTVTMIGVSRYN